MLMRPLTSCAATRLIETDLLLVMTYRAVRYCYSLRLSRAL